jgi:hypothetical protein
MDSAVVTSRISSFDDRLGHHRSLLQAAEYHVYLSPHRKRCGFPADWSLVSLHKVDLAWVAPASASNVNSISRSTSRCCFWPKSSTAPKCRHRSLFISTEAVISKIAPPGTNLHIQDVAFARIRRCFTCTEVHDLLENTYTATEVSVHAPSTMRALGGLLTSNNAVSTATPSAI